MRKIIIVARREFTAAVKTKTFLISLLIMPILMLGSIAIQLLLKDVQDTRTRRYAVIDRTPSAVLLPAIRAALASYNDNAVFGPQGNQILPRFEIEEVAIAGDSRPALDQMREMLSERVRKGDLSGFLEIGPWVIDPIGGETNDTNPDDSGLRYQSNRITQQEFLQRATAAVNEKVQALRGEAAHINEAKRQQMKRILEPVKVMTRGLARRNAKGELEDTTQQSLAAGLFVPAGMMMLMFMVVMMAANPLLQGVIEEKMQRIAEVLLGSLTPFELMMGKLLGMTGVSLTISGVYLAGAWWAAWRYGFAEYLPLELVVWFLIYQSLAGLLFGSLFIAIGAACTDMKEAQNLLMPVMLLVCLPLFVLGTVMREPNSPVATGLSFFPFATPMLMIARQSAPPGIPLWQPLVGVVLVLATTLFCVWAAGRIFRVGLLMQGKGANLGELIRWIFKG